MTATLDQQARRILLENDQGGYTVPTKGLYPYQWNWDSCFVALGFAQFDPARAWQELDSLLQAQWDDGMVPHIVFRRNDPTYFPGPDVWGAAGRNPHWPTSGISQPPVAATVVRRLVEGADDRDPAVERARALFPRLLAWHRWWHAARDPDGLGIIAIAHPWEAGRDNLPDWDRPGAAIDVSAVGDYRRRDTQHVDVDMRPKKLDYDRYLALVQFGRERDWDFRRIAADSPFWVAEVGITAILLRAERDLAWLAQLLGEGGAVAEIGERIARMEAGFERFWSPRAGAYCSLDLRRGEPATHANAATFLCFYAGAGAADHRRAQLDLLARWRREVRYLVPSYDPAGPAFDHLRYWRGPVWAIMNYLIGTGLAEAGNDELADAVRAYTRKLIEQKGFGEYFSAVDGRGCGGGAFSWTAAIWLAWASPSTDQVA